MSIAIPADQFPAEEDTLCFRGHNPSVKRHMGTAFKSGNRPSFEGYFKDTG